MRMSTSKKDEPVVFSVRLRPSLIRELRHEAKIRDWKIPTLMRVILREWLARSKSEESR